MQPAAPSPPVNRNDPCPCGSGKRYKHCHGGLGEATPGGSQSALGAQGVSVGLATAPRALRSEALAAYRAGELRRAEALYRQAIAERPDDAEVLNGLTTVLFDRLRYGEALELFRNVADRTGWADSVNRQNIGLALAKLLSPQANARQEALVAHYFDRERMRTAAPARSAHISVVLIANGDLEPIERSIASIAGQTYKDLDLVVVHSRSEEPLASRVAECTTRLPFSSTVVDNPPSGPERTADARFAFAANLGAQRAQGDYLAFVDAGDRFAPDRIEVMLCEIARTDPAWGFSRVAYVPSDNRAASRINEEDGYQPDHGSDRGEKSGESPAGAEAEPRAWDAPADELPSFALRNRDIACANGNLFVARRLFQELGGYREIDHPGWDLCVRAARVTEPVVVDRRLYTIGGRDRIRVTASSDPRVRQAIERRRDQIVADALAGRASASNEFCPQFPANRALLLHAELAAGRGDRIPIPVLRSLAEEWCLRVATRTAAAAPRVRSEPTCRPSAKVALVVLGVYRSGTSALTRVINLCGAALPQHMMAARLDLNRKGFWETEAVVDLDARMLRRVGAEWHSADIVLPRDGPMVEEFLATAGEVLAREYEDGEMILLKDPRICVLAPIWHQALIQSGYRPAYVVSVRHPLEVASSVARSLRSYGGLALHRGLALWQSYMQRVEAFVEGTDAKVVHVRYDALLADWRRVVGRIAQRLVVPLDVDARADEIDQFLESDMRRHRADDAALDRDLAAIWHGSALIGTQREAVRDLYRRLLDRCNRDGGDWPPT